MKKNTTLLPLLVFTTQAASDCTCGYTLPSTSSHSPPFLFTELLETDFLHLKHTDVSSDWIPQVYNVTPENARGPFGKISQLGNVVSNPIPSVYDWTGPGILGGDPGLQLWSRSQLIDVSGSDEGKGKMVPIAELVSSRNDILYGSFRFGLLGTKVEGTCAAVFFYRNDSMEIDIEFLSRQQQQQQGEETKKGVVNLVIQSPESAKMGGVDHASPDFDEHVLGFEPGEGYNEYRFDWFPGWVEFYANGELLSTTTQNVPDREGSIHLIHWSNGDQGWSGGPPEEDAVLTVSYVKAYFNSSIEDTTRESLKDCQGKEGEEEKCEIPDQKIAPDLRAVNGNQTGKTFFFTDQAGGHGEGGDGDVRSTSDAAGGIIGWQTLVMAMWSAIAGLWMGI